MKIAIVSDMHIGYERFCEDAYIQAKKALFLASELADAVIIPGDVFDKRNPHADAISQAIEIFRDLSRKEWKSKVVEFIPYRDTRSYTSVPIIAIPGTHERVAEGKRNPLTLLGLAGLLVDASEASVTIQKGDERVSVFGLGGIAEERLKEAMKALDPRPIPGNFNIFMFHQSIYELLPFREEFIRFDDLPVGFDLYVDGHIHNRIVETAHGKQFLIPGSTVLTQLKDSEQDSKGFFVYDTETKLFEFVEINSRPFVSLHLKFNDAEPKAVTERCEKEIEDTISRNQAKPIIKLHIEGTVAKGFKAIDMPTRSIYNRFSTKAIIDIDMRLVDKETQSEINELREGKLDGLSIKELGLGIFNAKLKENSFDEKINPSELFNMLSTLKKEKALEEITKLFESLE